MLQSHIVMGCRVRSVVCSCLLLYALHGGIAMGQGTGGGTPSGGQVGWLTVELPGQGSQFDRYLPQGVDIQTGAPLVVFLHATGTDIALYQDDLRAAADQLRLVVALPRSSSPRGWGFGNDFDIVDATIVTVARDIAIQPGKVAIAGHGSGAGYAYLLAYLTELRLSAVFAMSAPFLPVSAVLSPRYAPPIRMYFGANDSAASRDAPRLRQQWDFLGLDWEEEIRPGFGHSTWPLESMLDGLRFLVDRTAPPDSNPPCTPGSSSLCLQQGRFLAEVSFKESANRVGRGTVASPRTKDSGLFWFYEPTNWELLVKVLDGCAVNGHHWVFASASTSLDYRITVTDLETHQTVQYRHRSNDPLESVADIEAFATCDAALP